MKHNESIIEAYVRRYEINRSEAIIMASRETPKERIATYLEWKAMTRKKATPATAMFQGSRSSMSGRR